MTEDLDHQVVVDLVEVAVEDQMPLERDHLLEETLEEVIPTAVVVAEQVVLDQGRLIRMAHKVALDWQFQFSLGLCLLLCHHLGRVLLAQRDFLVVAVVPQVLVVNHLTYLVALVEAGPENLVQIHQEILPLMEQAVVVEVDRL